MSLQACATTLPDAQEIKFKPIGDTTGAVNRMQSSRFDARVVAQSGIEALRKGDALKARSFFERIVVAGQADASIFLGLSYACSSLQDYPAALAAADGALNLEPRNLRALILKADHFAKTGDARTAAAFYQAAVKAAPPLHQLPADMHPELARAQSMCDQYSSQFEMYLRDQLMGAGYDEGRRSARFADSLEILFGKKTVYFQQPKFYYFPELPQIQFYDRQDFPWLDRVEAATAAIRAELQEILTEDSAFTPYVQGEANRPQAGQSGMLNNPDWSAFYLWKNGEAVAENAARCPKTMEALADVPITKVAKRSPSILFSLLRPGARIPAHTGFVNTRLICHLPLIVPPRCGFRVGNDTREWVEGRAWLFDDTIEHEAWNLSDQTRVILLFEIWRPELTENERKSVTSMFEAVDRQGGGSPGWNI